MSEINNKTNENISENALIDEFVKMGINIESTENKINYTNSNSNKKDLAFNYYFGNNPLNKNLQSNKNFVRPDFSQMEQFYRNNSGAKNPVEAINLNKDFINPKDNNNFNNFNFSPEEFFKFLNNNSVSENGNNNKNNNITQFNLNNPLKQNFLEDSSSNNNNNNDNNNKKNPINYFANVVRDEVISPINNNNNNNNFNLNPDNFFQNNNVNLNGIFLNNHQLREQNAFLNNQIGNKEINNYANFNNNHNPNGINADALAGFFQNQNHILNNFFQQNNFNKINNNNSNPIAISNFSFKSVHKNNNFNRNDRINPKIMNEQAVTNGFPNMGGYINANKGNQYQTGFYNNGEARININSFANNQNNTNNANYYNFNNDRVNNNAQNFNSKNQKNRIYNNQIAYANKAQIMQNNHINQEMQGINNRFFDSDNFNQETIPENRSNSRRFNQQNLPIGDFKDNNNSNNNYQKKKNNSNKSNKQPETNESYLLTNPNLLNTQVNSLINLNVMNGTRYFIIKSVDEDNVHKGIKYNIWCSTIKGNQKLQKAFRDADGKFPIYLLFSVNSSGRFLGVAQMTSEIEYRANFNYWSQTEKWKGFFFVKWIYIKDIPNRAFRNLINEYNENKPVPTSRDTQEVSPFAGAEMIKIFNEYAHESSILDDFKFFERKQENVLTKTNVGAEAPEITKNVILDENIMNSPKNEEKFIQGNKAINDLLNVNSNQFINNPIDQNNNNLNFCNQNLSDLNENLNNKIGNSVNVPLPLPLQQQIPYGNSVKLNNFNMNNVNNMNLIYNQNNFYNIHNSNNLMNLAYYNRLNFANKISEPMKKYENAEEENENNQEANHEDSNKNISQNVFDARNLYLMNLDNKNSGFLNNPEMLKAFLQGQSNSSQNNFQFSNRKHNFFSNLNENENQSNSNNCEENEHFNIRDDRHSHEDSEKSFSDNFEKCDVRNNHNNYNYDEVEIIYKKEES